MEQQASTLLSALWHEAGLPDNQPAAFVAADRTLAALLGAAPAAALPQAVTMLAALQLEALQAGSLPAAQAAGVNGGTMGAAPAAAAGHAGTGGSRLGVLSAAHACAVLCVCRSALHMLAVQLGQPALARLAVPGCQDVLPRLAVGPAGGVDLEDGESPGQAVQLQQWERFWQAPAALQEFSADEQQRAAAFLAEWRRGVSVAQQEEALAAALASVPLFKQAAAGGGRFQPVAAAALMPRVMQVGQLPARPQTDCCRWMLAWPPAVPAERSRLLRSAPVQACGLANQRTWRDLGCRATPLCTQTALPTAASAPRGCGVGTSTCGRSRCWMATALCWWGQGGLRACSCMGWDVGRCRRRAVPWPRALWLQPWPRQPCTAAARDTRRPQQPAAWRFDHADSSAKALMHPPGWMHGYEKTRQAYRTQGRSAGLA